MSTGSIHLAVGGVSEFSPSPVLLIRERHLSTLEIDPMCVYREAMFQRYGGQNVQVLFPEVRPEGQVSAKFRPNTPQIPAFEVFDVAA